VRGKPHFSADGGAVESAICAAPLLLLLPPLVPLVPLAMLPSLVVYSTPAGLQTFRTKQNKIIE